MTLVTEMLSLARSLLRLKSRKLWHTAANLGGVADLSGYEVTSDAFDACQQR